MIRKYNITIFATRKACGGGSTGLDAALREPEARQAAIDEQGQALAKAENQDEGQSHADSATVYSLST